MSDTDRLIAECEGYTNPAAWSAGIVVQALAAATIASALQDVSKAIEKLKPREWVGGPR